MNAIAICLCWIGSVSSQVSMLMSIVGVHFCRFTNGVSIKHSLFVCLHAFIHSFIHPLVTISRTNFVPFFQNIADLIKHRGGCILCMDMREYVSLSSCVSCVKWVWKYANDTFHFVQLFGCSTCDTNILILFSFHVDCTHSIYHLFYQWYQWKQQPSRWNVFFFLCRMRTMDFCWETTNPSRKFWQINCKRWKILTLIHPIRFCLGSLLVLGLFLRLPLTLDQRKLERFIVRSSY